MLDHSAAILPRESPCATTSNTAGPGVRQRTVSVTANNVQIFQLIRLVLGPLSRQINPAFNFAAVCGDDLDSLATVERWHIFVAVQNFKVASAQPFEDCAVGDGVLQFCDEVVALAAARVAGETRRACVDGAA